MKINARLIILLTIIKGISFPLFSQSLDSLSQLPDDSVKLSLLKEKAITLSEDAPEESLLFAQAGIRLAIKLKMPIAEGECYKAGGVAHDLSGNLDSSLWYHNSAKRIFTEQKQVILLSNTISDVALAYYFRGIYAIALQNHFDALKLREEAGNKSLISKSYNNIGLVYRARKDYNNAIRYYLKSFALKKELNDQAGQLNSLMNIGSSYQYQRKYDSALYYGKQTLTLSRTIHKPRDEVNSLANLGVAYTGLQQWDQAEIHLMAALAKADSSEYKEPLYSIYEGLGTLMISRKNYKQAIDWFNKGVMLATESKRKEMLANYYDNLADCHEKTGDYNLAYNFIRNSEAIRDSLLNEENLRQLNEINTMYETAKKEETISQLNKAGMQKEIALIRSKRERNYFIVAAFLFSLLAGLAYYAYRSNKRKNQLLNNQKMVIEKSLREKEMLIREIHHRVKNNLQIISGLLNLQSRQIENTEAQEAVREGRNRVKSMALIHQKLYQQENLTAVNMEEYLNDLVNSIQETFKFNNKNIRTTVNSHHLQFDVDTAIPLGLIINELVTNSYKYAFARRESGILQISLEENISKKIVLEVKDNGEGFPPGFDSNNGKSFGMKLLQSLAAKLEAAYQFSNDNGAVFRMTFINQKPV